MNSEKGKVVDAEVLAHRRERMIVGVRRGDIFIIPAWYIPDTARETMAIYQAAAETRVGDAAVPTK